MVKYPLVGTASEVHRRRNADQGIQKHQPNQSSQYHISALSGIFLEIIRRYPSKRNSMQARIGGGGYS